MSRRWGGWNGLERALRAGNNGAPTTTAAAGGTPLDLPGGPSLMQDAAAAGEAFYELAVRRSAIMVEKSLAAARKAGRNRLVLIAGGFHTPDILARLRSLDVPYAVVTPSFAKARGPSSIIGETLREPSVLSGDPYDPIAAHASHGENPTVLLEKILGPRLSRDTPLAPLLPLLDGLHREVRNGNARVAYIVYALVSLLSLETGKDDIDPSADLDAHLSAGQSLNVEGKKLDRLEEEIRETLNARDAPLPRDIILDWATRITAVLKTVLDAEHAVSHHAQEYAVPDKVKDLTAAAVAFLKMLAENPHESALVRFSRVFFAAVDNLKGDHDTDLLPSLRPTLEALVRLARLDDARVQKTAAGIADLLPGDPRFGSSDPIWAPSSDELGRAFDRLRFLAEALAVSETLGEEDRGPMIKALMHCVWDIRLYTEELKEPDPDRPLRLWESTVRLTEAAVELTEEQAPEARYALAARLMAEAMVLLREKKDPSADEIMPALPASPTHESAVPQSSLFLPTVFMVWPLGAAFILESPLLAAAAIINIAPFLALIQARLHAITAKHIDPPPPPPPPSGRFAWIVSNLVVATFLSVLFFFVAHGIVYDGLLERIPQAMDWTPLIAVGAFLSGYIARQAVLLGAGTLKSHALGAGAPWLLAVLFGAAAQASGQPVLFYALSVVLMGVGFFSRWQILLAVLLRAWFEILHRVRPPSAFSGRIREKSYATLGVFSEEGGASSPDLLRGYFRDLDKLRRRELARQPKAVSDGHSHDDGHDGHGHSHGADRMTPYLWASFAVTAVYMGVEIAFGLWQGSIPLLGDGGHMLVHALALSVTMGAIALPRLKWVERRFGPMDEAEVKAFRKRLSFWGALINGILLLGILFWNTMEAVEHLSGRHFIQGGMVLAVAAGGLIVNIISLWLLIKDSQDDINLKSLMLHTIDDAVGSLFAIGAGVIIWIDGPSAAAWDAVLGLLLVGAISIFVKNLLRDAWRGLELGMKLRQFRWVPTAALVLLAACIGALAIPSGGPLPSVTAPSSPTVLAPSPPVPTLIPTPPPSPIVPEPPSALRSFGTVHTPVTTLKLQADPGPDKKALVRLPDGMPLEILERKAVGGREWLKVGVQGQEGWVSARHIQETGTSAPAVTTLAASVVTSEGHRLNFRRGPGLSPENIIGSLPRGTALTVLSPERVNADGEVWRFVQIKQDGRLGWVAERLISMENATPRPMGVRMIRLHLAKGESDKFTAVTDESVRPMSVTQGGPADLSDISILAAHLAIVTAATGRRFSLADDGQYEVLTSFQAAALQEALHPQVPRIVVFDLNGFVETLPEETLKGLIKDAGRILERDAAQTRTGLVLVMREGAEEEIWRRLNIPPSPLLKWARTAEETSEKVNELRKQDSSLEKAKLNILTCQPGEWEIFPDASIFILRLILECAKGRLDIETEAGRIWRGKDFDLRGFTLLRTSA